MVGKTDAIIRFLALENIEDDHTCQNTFIRLRKIIFKIFNFQEKWMQKIDSVPQII